ncbi:MAG: DUF5682 family protein [Phycisphaeraceae bacterium JB051]
MSEKRVHLFGIRHHGPGSARSLEHALEQLAPDCLLIEGPPDADAILPLAEHMQMQPPVAMLIYRPDDPSRAAFYPFAAFSPEWRAIQFGLKNKVQTRFMDLPQWFGLADQVDDVSAYDHAQNHDNIEQACCPTDIQHDPLGHLAEAAGFSDGERWWDHMVEGRRHEDSEIFTAVNQAMSALRQQINTPESLHERRREAHMRKMIRQAMKQDYQRIAVVCGAWHAPALDPDNFPKVKDDNALLKGLKKVKTQAAWSPWTYGRLALGSGYGAGVVSPAWYELLWSNVEHVATQWLTQVARLMRDQDMDTSSAHVIEAVRLADALAALRHRPMPGLEELNEAALTVICAGHDAPMQLIHRKLVIGEKMGAVPDDAPIAPLQRDLAALQKSLRLKVTTEILPVDLDLRKEMDLKRSHLLHRLNLLGIGWGEMNDPQHQAKGTFHEYWQLQWQPEFVVQLIEGSRYGNTVETAASNRTIQIAGKTDQLTALTALLNDTLLAQLPDAVKHLVDAIQNKAASSSDIPQLMTALPPLAQVVRYGNVRQTDAEIVREILTGLLTRVCVSLPANCASLNDDAAGLMLNLITQAHSALTTLADAALLTPWHEALKRIPHHQSTHPLLVGKVVRILHDTTQIQPEQTQLLMSQALSPGADRLAAAAWIEGFLSGSGLVLIHDQALWSLIDDWVSSLRDETFIEVLPLLRRTFSSFPIGERRQMGMRLKQSEDDATNTTDSTMGFDHQQAAQVLPTVAQLLGVEIRA